jgi:hypothetical protein
LANLVTVDAIHDHRLAHWDLLSPFGDIVGRAALRSHKHPVVGIERGRPPHVEHERR